MCITKSMLIFSMPLKRKLIVCADDFGIDHAICTGIVYGHTQGIITSTALLMNAPFTGFAIELSKDAPDLEVGLHLSIVEGYCLSGQLSKSLLDPENYFSQRPCLHRNWKQFLKKFCLGQISMLELEREFRMQIEAFLTEIGPIPFLNSTQHLHCLPPIGKLVVSLCQEYGIKNIRLPKSIDRGARLNSRKIQAELLQSLSRRLRKKTSLRAPDLAFGFTNAGALTRDLILGFLPQIQENEVAEIMAHPGHDSATLRELLPQSYGTYNWSGELAALVDPEIKLKMSELGIELATFSTCASFETGPAGLSQDMHPKLSPIKSRNFDFQR
ncbi:MAG: hypothetical protein A2X86_02735 [Bdellovibrionales bacterium GWA2_49_15]|nr:MAG: hypothetical protein A2X86_02735 [Bdellovibrionales bacterium GWA2_49_15]HAZ14145.1 hypothetical protein [Bdellovibrionales bacterium]